MIERTKQDIEQFHRDMAKLHKSQVKNASQEAICGALSGIDVIIASFQTTFPPPYLDQSHAGIAWQALRICRETIAAQLMELKENK